MKVKHVFYRRPVLVTASVWELGMNGFIDLQHQRIEPVSSSFINQKKEGKGEAKGGEEIVA